MSWPLAVVFIVLIVAIGKVMTAKYRSQGGIISDRRGNKHWIGPGSSSANPQPDSDTKREVEDLRERIKVLERIATDGNSLDARETKRISAEIEALREKQVDRD
ncbi:hypothetical protein [Qipengyuania qiaonensis]|uniref:Uncharacterized protein n=1 Tax=Qipengyuania qiaonensis TaxID=2867240 RepID=A0ABS7J8W4_9SPHN|nr:hypothetical protein [Qipengyuania qiaonensis]MBX7483761.1 hypothetical protein [Qipengyuania qiaonensis]